MKQSISLGAEYIVVSSAIKKNSIEILSALEQKIPVLTRAEMLAELFLIKSASWLLNNSRY